MKTACDFFLTGLALLLGSPLWLLPWNAACRLGRVYGYCGFLLWPEARRTGMINLRRAYGSEVSCSKARRWTFQVFGNMGQSLAEGIQFGRRYKDAGNAWEQFCEIEDRALADRLRQDPRPKIFASGHLGSWEAALQLLSLSIQHQGAAVVRRTDNPFLNRVIRRLRLKTHSQWIEKTGAVTECLRRLQGGESVAILFDENGRWHGSCAQFFGRPASTRKTAALLSLITGAPIVLGAMVRRKGSQPYLFKLALIEPSCFERRPESHRQITQAMLNIFERWVREYPLQWRWIHWRWKNRPDGSEESYSRRDLIECFAPESERALATGLPGSPSR
jgi:KDO2-lipid IV(A) lauroyltransferase